MDEAALDERDAEGITLRDAMIAAGYDPKKFNALLRGRKRLTSDDVVPICKALGVTPNELFGIDHPATPEKSA